MPITLPSPAGLANSGNNEIKTDTKLPSSSQTNAKPTTQADRVTILNNESGVVDVSKKPNFGIKNYPPNNGAVNGTENLEYLQPGAQIDRYGSLNGTYASPSGTPLELRSLPSSNSGVLNSFEVLKPFPVQSSTIAPWYNQPGGGIQYKLPKSINWLLDNRFIK